MRSRNTLVQRLLSAVRSLTSAQDPQQQAQQARASVTAAISGAQSQVTGVKNFISSLSAGIGPDAHTRIAEAESCLNYAISVQSTDPLSSLTYARRAADLAQRAGQIAQADLNGYPMSGGRSRGGYGGGFGGFGGRGFGGGLGRRGYGGGGFASGLGGGILGGLLGGILSGGNRGWGGGFDDDDRGFYDNDGGFDNDGGGFGGDGGGWGGDSGGGFGGGDSGSF